MCQRPNNCLLSVFWCFWLIVCRVKNRILWKSFQWWHTNMLPFCLLYGHQPSEFTFLPTPPFNCQMLTRCGLWSGVHPSLSVKWRHVVPNRKPLLGVRLHHHCQGWKFLWNKKHAGRQSYFKGETCMPKTQFDLVSYTFVCTSGLWYQITVHQTVIKSKASLSVSPLVYRPDRSSDWLLTLQVHFYQLKKCSIECEVVLVFPEKAGRSYNGGQGISQFRTGMFWTGTALCPSSRIIEFSFSSAF